MGGKSGGDAAEQMRREEQERQERIRQGMERINAIFDGGFTVSDPVEAGAAFDPNATYFLPSGEVWNPNAKPGDPGFLDITMPQETAPRPSSDARAQTGRNFAGGPATGSGRDLSGALGARVNDIPIIGDFVEMVQGATGPSLSDLFQQAAREGDLFTSRTEHEGFGDDFFDARRQSYIDYAMPQLEDQYSDALRELTFSLARSGNLNSSVRGEKAAEAQKLYDTRAQEIADKALSFETDARNAIESARSDLIRTLQATGDASAAANSAIARARALSQPPAYSPLGQLFLDFTAGLGSQAALERAEAATGNDYARYNTGLFGLPKDAVRTLG